MKNEDRIVELLSESLLKQDVQAELIVKNTQHIDVLSDQIGRMSDRMDTLIDVTIDMAKAIKKNSENGEALLHKIDFMQDHEQRISALERKTNKSRK